MDDISKLLARFHDYFAGQTYFDVDEIVSLIDYFLEKDDMANLKTAIELGYKLHPDDPYFKLALCKSLIVMEDYNTALRLLDEIALDDDEDAILMRLECLCELNRYPEVLKCIEKMEEEDNPCLQEAVEQTACIMNDSNHSPDDTYDFIEYYLELFPDNLTLRTELCFNFEQLGKTQDAMKLCKQLIDEDPYSAELWYMQGRLYSLCSQFEKAVDSCDFALTCLQDEDEDMAAEIKIMEIYCLYKIGACKKAVDIYEDLNKYGILDDYKMEQIVAECYNSIGESEKAACLTHSTTTKKQTLLSKELINEYINNNVHKN